MTWNLIWSARHIPIYSSEASSSYNWILSTGYRIPNTESINTLKDSFFSCFFPLLRFFFFFLISCGNSCSSVSILSRKFNDEPRVLSTYVFRRRTYLAYTNVHILMPHLAWICSIIIGELRRIILCREKCSLLFVNNDEKWWNEHECVCVCVCERLRARLLR